MLSYNVPTVGIGCRSASYLIYGILCTLPWVLQLLPGFRTPRATRKGLVFAICTLSTLVLIFINFAAVSHPIFFPHVIAIANPDTLLHSSAACSKTASVEAA